MQAITSIARYVFITFKYVQITRGPRPPATYCALRMVKGREKSRMRTTYQPNQYEIRGFFSRMRSSCQNPRKVMGFSGSVNGTTQNPGFFYLGFCQCKWAYCNVTMIHFMIWKSGGGMCINRKKDFFFGGGGWSYAFRHLPPPLNPPELHMRRSALL